MKRKKPRGRKKPSVVETSPEALEETWKAVEEELKATGFQVSVRINLKGQQRAFIGRGQQNIVQELVALKSFKFAQ